MLRPTSSTRPVPGRALMIGVLLSAFAITLPAQQPVAGTAPRVPLREGLTIVTALFQPGKGDYESLKVITLADASRVRLAYSSDVPDDKGVKQVNVTRTIPRQDLENAVEYRNMYSNGAPESFPGSTAVGVSRRVLTDLKTKGESPLKVNESGIMGALGSLFDAILGEGSKETGNLAMISGTLKRVEPRSVPFKVLLNDAAVELPVIHARGKFDDANAEFWILDDPDNPLAMKWDIGEDHLQVIRLSYPVVDRPASGGAGTPPPPGRGAIRGGPGSGPAGGTLPAGGGGGGGAGSGAGAGGAGSGADAAAAGTAKRIEADLTKTGRSIVYGIYFDFASDKIKKESEPVLAEIAQVLKQNPTWNISVEGHTDSIGGDPYNLDLSQRRSAAVKQALVTRYQIDARRMQTSGFGARVPKDRNDTIEGRARNRRVELVKAG